MKMRIVLALAFCVMAIGISDYFIREYVAAKRTCSDKAYPYIFADKDDVKEAKGSLRLWVGSANGMSCDISIWISPAEANRDANNPLYWSLPQYKFGYKYLYEGSIKLGKDIGYGNYIVEMATSNGTVVEEFRISKEEINKGSGIEIATQGTLFKKNNQILPLPEELR